jgi:hypothetical protein
MNSPIPRLTVLVCALTTLLVLAAPARGYIGIIMQPIPETIVLADVVVTGKLTAKEEKTIRAQIYPDHAGVWEYDLYELTVDKVLKGKAGKTLRVGVPRAGMSSAKPVKVKVEGGEIVINPQVKRDVEGTFLLIKHHQRDFYVVPPMGGFLDKNEAIYKQELALLRRCAALLERPGDGLRAKDKEDRFLTAYMLIYDYGFKERRKGASKGLVPEPIAADQGRLILQALLEGEWRPRKGGLLGGPLSPPYPQNAVNWLPVDEESAKGRPDVKLTLTDAAAYAEAGRKWLRAIRDSARLHRLVREKPPTKK